MTNAAKRRIVAAVDDMFFASKIRAVAESKGVEVVFAKNPDAVAKALADERPTLVIADLNSERCDPLSLARRLKASEETRAIPLIGFLSHVQTALKRSAEEAGYDRVMARSAFTARLPQIISGELEA